MTHQPARTCLHQRLPILLCSERPGVTGAEGTRRVAAQRQTRRLHAGTRASDLLRKSPNRQTPGQQREVGCGRVGGDVHATRSLIAFGGRKRRGVPRLAKQVLQHAEPEQSTMSSQQARVVTPLARSDHRGIIPRRAIDGSTVTRSILSRSRSQTSPTLPLARVRPEGVIATLGESVAEMVHDRSWSVRGVSEDLCRHERTGTSCLQQQRRGLSIERGSLTRMAPAARR